MDNAGQLSPPNCRFEECLQVLLLSFACPVPLLPSAVHLTAAPVCFSRRKSCGWRDQQSNTAQWPCEWQFAWIGRTVPPDPMTRRLTWLEAGALWPQPPPLSCSTRMAVNHLQAPSSRAFVPPPPLAKDTQERTPWQVKSRPLFSAPCHSRQAVRGACRYPRIYHQLGGYQILTLRSRVGEGWQGVGVTATDVSQPAIWRGFGGGEKKRTWRNFPLARNIILSLSWWIVAVRYDVFGNRSWAEKAKRQHSAIKLNEGGNKFSCR